MNTHQSINVRGSLLDMQIPKIMGIINTTPDSFYEKSRAATKKDISETITEFINNGADIIDVGGYSSRPGATDISPQREMERLKPALAYVAEHYPEFPVSVDTYRSEVARWAIEHYTVGIINDISGGNIDSDILHVAAESNTPYIGMHMVGNPQNMQQFTNYENIMRNITLYFSAMIEKAKQAGVCDIIIDPGFGFSKTIDDNYLILKNLKDFQILERPVLIGISRKSMIYKYLNINSSESLYGTIALQALALQSGASIIRVHDVKPAVQMLKVVCKTLNQQS